jgi:cytochrome c5
MSTIFLSRHVLAALALSTCLLTACEDEPTTASDECADDEDCEAASDEDDDDATDSKDDAPKANTDRDKDAGTKAPAKDAGNTTSGKVDAGTKANPPTPAAGDLPCDVKAIVEKHCSSCHGAKPVGAPMSLVTAADFQKTGSGGKKMHELTKLRINEKDPAKAMPPSTGKTEPLTPDALAALNRWLDQGAAAGTATCEGGGDAPPAKDDTGASIDTTGLSCVKFLASQTGDGKSKFKLGVQKDGYFNFTFVPPWKQMVYGVVIRPIIDNAAVLHHWLLFQDNALGKASGPVQSVGAHPAGQLVHGWAPGGDPLDARDSGDVGIEFPPVSYTVEFHYNSSDASAEDASGVEVCYNDKKPANIAGLSWLGWDQLGIPAQTWSGTCRPTSQQPIHIMGVSPHMHKTGRHMKAVINRKGGTTEILHDKPFDFDYQDSYLKDVTLMPGDTITTTCTFSQPMAFGEGTDAEMCYLFTMAYPKGALASPDIWGGLAHGGSSCLGQ